MRKSLAIILNLAFFINCYPCPSCFSCERLRGSEPLASSGTKIKTSVAPRLVAKNKPVKVSKENIPAANLSSQAGMSFNKTVLDVLPKENLSNEGIALDEIVTPGKSNKEKVNLHFEEHSTELVKTFNVLYDPKFGQVFLDISIENFDKLGFEYGDSVHAIFSNGFTLLDIPYHSGYSTKTGEPLLVSYPGTEHPALCRNNWHPLWNEAALKDGDKVTIILNKKNKFSVTEEVLKLRYSTSREDFKTDKIFANFRPVLGGSLKENLIFRGVSPFDNRYNRAQAADDLIKREKIDFLINLADKEDTVKDLIKRNQSKNNYSFSLYNKGKCTNLGLTCNYRSEGYAGRAVDGLKKYIEYCKKSDNRKPLKLYVHCLEGKDRTGFVCAVLQMLCGASYEEILDDYMMTYENYYGITKKSAFDKYMAIKDFKFDDFVDYLVQTYGDENLKKEGPAKSFIKAAEGYLKFGGMTEKQIEDLKKIISR